MRYHVLLIISLLSILSSNGNNQKLKLSDTSIIHSIFENFMDSPPQELFQIYITTYNKPYTRDSEEGKKRFAAFEDNLKFIKEENSSQEDYKLGLTPFADLTFEEFKEKHLMNPEIVKKLMQNIQNQATSKNEKFLDFDLHADDNEDHSTTSVGGRGAIDWKDLFGSIRSQGSCGSCWAFAATGAAEAGYKKKNGGSPFYLSPQQLVDCDREQSQGCNGGMSDRAMEYMKTTGLVSDTTYPYKGKDGQCQSNIIESNQRYTVSGYDSQGNVDSNTWYSNLQKGPLVVYIEATKKFQFYILGLLSLTGCGEPNHAIIAMGWGKWLKFFDEYVHVRNSWGKLWGELGYARLKFYEEGTCHVTKFFVIPYF